MKILMRILSILVGFIGLFTFFIGIGNFFTLEDTVQSQYEKGNWGTYIKRPAVIDSVIIRDAPLSLSRWRSVREKTRKEKFRHYDYIVRYSDEYDIERIDTVHVGFDETKTEADYQKGSELFVYYDPQLVKPLLSEAEYAFQLPTEKRYAYFPYVVCTIGLLLLFLAWWLWRRGGRRSAASVV